MARWGLESMGKIVDSDQHVELLLAINCSILKQIGRGPDPADSRKVAPSHTRIFIMGAYENILYYRSLSY